MAALTPPQDNDGIVELTDLIERGPYAPDDRTTQPDAGSEAPGSAAPDVSFSGEKPGDAPRAHEEASEDSRRAAEDQGDGGAPSPAEESGTGGGAACAGKEKTASEAADTTGQAAAPEEETASTSPAGTPGQAIRE